MHLEITSSHINIREHAGACELVHIGNLGQVTYHIDKNNKTVGPKIDKPKEEITIFELEELLSKLKGYKSMFSGFRK